MQTLQIPSGRGHDVIEFDKATGVGVKEAMEKIQKLVGEERAKLITRKADAPQGEYRPAAGFDDLEDVSVIKRQNQGG